MVFQTEVKETIKVCGLTRLLTRSQQKNYGIISNHWRMFNQELRSRKLWQGKDWKKYGITYQHDGNYYYMAAIQESAALNGFLSLEITDGMYAHFQHQGSMELLKATYYKIYKQTIPQHQLVIDKSRTILHYEQYGSRFHWNRSDSIIDIYVPLNNRNE